MSLSIPNSTSSEIELMEQLSNMALTSINADRILQEEIDTVERKFQKLFSEVKNTYDLAMKEHEQLKTENINLEHRIKELKNLNKTLENSIQAQADLNQRLHSECNELNTKFKLQEEESKKMISVSHLYDQKTARIKNLTDILKS